MSAEQQPDCDGAEGISFERSGSRSASARQNRELTGLHRIWKPQRSEFDKVNQNRV